MFRNSNYVAQKNLHGIKQNDSYKTEISQTVNSANFATSQIVRKNLKSEDFFIPKDWRLVSVIPRTSFSSRNSEYILFFSRLKIWCSLFGHSDGWCSYGI